MLKRIKLFVYATFFITGFILIPASFVNASSAFDQLINSSELEPQQSIYMRWTFVDTSFAPNNVAFYYRVNTQPAGLGLHIDYCDTTYDDFTMAGDSDPAGEYTREFTLDGKTVCKFTIQQQYPTGRSTLYGKNTTDSRWTFDNPGGGYTGGDFTPAMMWNYSGGTSDGNPNLAGQDLTQNFVIFADPPFSDGLTTPDFKNWWVCTNIVSGGAGSSHYYYYVNFDYGTSSPYSYTDDNSAIKYPLYSLPNTECPIFTKKHDLAEGEYQAVASLYAHYPLSGDHFIASSSIYSFTVATGTQVNYPQQNQPESLVECNFDVSNTGVSAIDDTVNGIINGGCKILSYLFIPSDTSLKQYSNLWTTLENKPPFGYFNAVTNSLDLSSGTPSSTIIAIGGYIGTFDEILNPLNTGISVIIYVAGAFWIFNRLRKFNFHQ